MTIPRSLKLWPPVAAWLTLALALAAGAYLHWQSPAGVFLYTPQDWCRERTSSFVVGYLGVLASGAAMFAVGGLACLVARAVTGPASNEKFKEFARSAWAAVLLLVAAAVLTPVVRIAFPMEPDLACINKK